MPRHKKVSRSLNSEDVVEVLVEAIKEYGSPQCIRSDNGSQFVAQKVRETHMLNPRVVSKRYRSACCHPCVESKYNTHHPHSRLGFLSANAFAKLWQELNPTGAGSIGLRPLFASIC